MYNGTGRVNGKPSPDNTPRTGYLPPSQGFEATLLKKPNKDLQEHQRKREIEVKCIELADNLEEEGLQQHEIDERVKELRSQLLEQAGYLEKDVVPVTNHQPPIPVKSGPVKEKASKQEISDRGPDNVQTEDMEIEENGITDEKKPVDGNEEKSNKSMREEKESSFKGDKLENDRSKHRSKSRERSRRSGSRSRKKSKSPSRRKSSTSRRKSRRSTSRSPGRRRRSESPRKRSKSPRKRSKSPRKRSKSPRKRSKSPRKRLSSGRRRSRRSRSRSKSRERKRSGSRKKSRSPANRKKDSVDRKKSASPERKKSLSPDPRKKSRSPERKKSRTPERRKSGKKKKHRSLKRGD